MDPDTIEQAIHEAYDDKKKGVSFYEYLSEDAQQLLQILAERGRKDGKRPNIAAVRRILARQGQTVGDTALRRWFHQEIGA